MATKYEIKKYLERKKSEALGRLDHERCLEIKSVEEQFVSDFIVEISAVAEGINLASDNLDRLIKRAAKSGVVFESKYYSNPARYINDASGSIAKGEITKYFSIPSVAKVKKRYEILTEEAMREYNKLLAITGNSSAKDGISLLKDLGFDTSNLEAVKETTALTINIDARKLFISKEGN